MKIEKRDSGSYRVRKTFNKKTYSITFDHKPTQKEVDAEFYARFNKGGSSGKKPMKNCVLEYIEARTNVISPSTMRSYITLSKSMTKDFANKNIYDIEQIDIQNEINAFSLTHSPKTVRNYHGLISAVFATYRPEMIIRTTLPQKRPSERYKPTENDIKAILNASVGSPYHIAFQLGVLGLRRGEVLGINAETDIEDNILHIHQVLVEGPEGWELKDVPKNDTSNRKILLPDNLVDEIRENGEVFSMSPNMILQALSSYQDKLGIPHFRFHDLRHYFASYAHAIGIPDVYIMEMGGWKTTTTMDKIYKEALADKSIAMKKLVADKLLP